ncbi:MAG TPA: LapA family protein [Dictyoglomaceae bacterium]|nr:LapA family protein [Dictyoglomaceae bacterium]HOL38988.1 LapA family protein [Dictyoglomaceae bacterium]HOP94327.1 LapA family protein [Dictyoglomaceae bacterium]HPP15836.1 LapA family protein [Dictyoglomaceae bacterium]HPU42825.1 LapA family protein [Dictyoglomaceae bacterium]
MSKLIIILLVGVILALLFSLQNQTEITIHFFYWSFQTTISTVTFLSFSIGAVLSFLSVIPNLVRDKRNITKLSKRVKELEGELEKKPPQEDQVGNIQQN